jgi:membrane fusion protein (multidrug efflux system)
MTGRRSRRIVASAVLGLALGACGGGSPGTGPGGGAGGGRPVPVKVVPVERQTWSDSIQALGTARANESVTITAKVTETVVRVNFEDGQEVAAGAVLVDLSGRAEAAALAEAQVAYEEASRLYERQLELSRQGTISEAVLDQQRAARDTAKARVDAIRARLGDRVITAPFAGVLGFRAVSPGTLVTPGTVITTLDDVDPIKVDFTVPERFLSALAVGQSIAARTAAWPGVSFEGRVTSIESRIDPVTRAVTVRAEVPNADRRLKPGMLMTLAVTANERESLVIPEIAVQAIRDRNFVFRVGEDGRAQQVFVTLGARRAGRVEVLDGLEAGDRIVTDGLVRVRAGVALRIQDPARAPERAG